MSPLEQEARLHVDLEVPVHPVTLDLIGRLAIEQDTTPEQLAAEWIERAAHEARVGMARDLALRVTCPVVTCQAEPGAPCSRGTRHGNAAVMGPHLRRVAAARRAMRPCERTGCRELVPEQPWASNPRLFCCEKCMRLAAQDPARWRRSRAQRARA